MTDKVPQTLIMWPRFKYNQSPEVAVQAETAGAYFLRDDADFPVITPDIAENYPQNYVPQLSLENTRPSPHDRRVKWGKRIGGAMLIGGGLLALANNPIDEIEHRVLENGPVPVAGLMLTEAAFLYGAGRMLVSAGKDKSVREAVNVFRTERKFGELIKGVAGCSDSVLTSPGFKNGLAINTGGALGTAAVIAAGAVATLPPEVWPGAFTIAAIDVAATVAVRTPVAAAVKGAESRVAAGVSVGYQEKETNKMSVRRATHEDLDKIVDLDLLLFKKAYGDTLPLREEVYEMMRRRMDNGAFMHVVERNGEVEGFISGFRTDKPATEFKSWEDTTNDGTLDGVVRPDGKYMYIVNQTIKHEAVVGGAQEMLYASLYADAVSHGIEYGYFESRLPHFSRWIESENKMTDDSEELTRLAKEYAGMKLPDGKLKDPMLRMYAADGFRLGNVVENAFSDAASMNYGVICIVDSPIPNKMLRKSKLVSKLVGGAIAKVANHPKILKKVM